MRSRSAAAAAPSALWRGHLRRGLAIAAVAALAACSGNDTEVLPATSMTSLIASPEQVVTIDELRSLANDGEARPGTVWSLRDRAGSRALAYCPPGTVGELGRVPVGSTILELECGVASRTVGTFGFRFEVEGRSDGWRSLAEMSVGPCDEAAGCWQRLRVPLAGADSGMVRLAVEATSGADLPPVVSGCTEARAVQGDRGPRPRNVLLVVVDTLRADRMSLYGHARPTTPELERWAGRGAVVFDRAFTHAPWTLPAHASLFTGNDPIHHGCNWNAPVPPAATLLAERLHNAGWTTMAVTGGGYLGPEFGLLQGFSRAAWWEGGEGSRTDVGDDIESGVAAAVEWLRDCAAEPFFLFFHTYEVHAPYRPRSPWAEQWGGEAVATAVATTRALEARPEDGFVLHQRFQVRDLATGGSFRDATAEDLPVIGALYDSGVAMADQGVGRILRELETLGLDERTVVVVTSDHGEALGEDGLVGHTSLDDREIRVPLVIRSPGPPSRSEPLRVAEVARLVDVVPTVLELLGLPGDPAVDGRSLRPLLEGRPDASSRTEAWAYAASTNFGIALRRDDGLDLRVRNDAWTTGEGRVEVVAVPDPSTAVEDEAEAVCRRYLAETRGFRLAFAAGATAALEVTLSGPELRPVRVKSCDAQRSAPRWNSGAVTWSLEPGESRLVVVEQPPASRLVVTAAITTSGPLAKALRETVHGGDTDRRWVWDGTAWVASPKPVADDQPWLAASFPDPEDLTREAATIDAETAMMLRALGYGE